MAQYLLARKKLQIGLALVGLFLVLAVGNHFYSRPEIIRCKDLRTKLPVFFEVESSGTVNISAHDRDGQVYAFSGYMPDHSNLNRKNIWFQHYMGGHALMDRRTGSFSVTSKDGGALYSGVCGQ